MDLVRTIAAALRPYDRCLPPALETKQDLGDYGERVAARFLKRHRFKVLYRNYRVLRGEIDLVCRDGEILAFVEVKTRRNELHGLPQQFVDRRKQKRISNAAAAYLQLLGNPPITYRFDIVEVLLRPDQIPECRLIRNAHPPI